VGASERPAERSAATVRALDPADWPAVRDIYAAGIASGIATFETDVPDWQTFDRAKLPDHRFVAADYSGVVIGWAAVSPVSTRAAYRGVVEGSVYVDPAMAGRGVGLVLLTALIDSTETAGIWTVQAGIFEENVASLRLHARAGFRVVGRRERIGRLDGRWRTVMLVERRSPQL